MDDAGERRPERRCLLAVQEVQNLVHVDQAAGDGNSETIGDAGKWLSRVAQDAKSPMILLLFTIASCQSAGKTSQ